MNSPFDDPDGSYSVLVNVERQYSLWPAFAPLPAGWNAVLRDRPRHECLEFISRAWRDMRPRSLAAD